MANLIRAGLESPEAFKQEAAMAFIGTASPLLGSSVAAAELMVEYMQNQETQRQAEQLENFEMKLVPEYGRENASFVSGSGTGALYSSGYIDDLGNITPKGRALLSLRNAAK